MTREGNKEEIRDLEDRGEVSTAFRELRGKWDLVVYIIGIAASVFHIWVNTIGVMPGIYRNAVHLGFILALAFFFYPTFKRKPQRGFGFDIFLVLLTCAVALYILLFEEELHLERGSVPIMRDYIFAAIAIVILLLGTYRAAGPIIPVLSIFFLAYALFLGRYIPGPFHHRGINLGRLLYRMYLTDEGMFGIVCTVSATYVYLFILFGAFLLKSGAGEFIIKLAQALTGRRVGGPAKIAVISSGFMGSVSGSAVANTVATGSFTIPLMKRIGYRPLFAGGVEAAASTGGQLMPPIMGAGAFIMAQYTGISYLKIIAVAAIPAVMYFLSVGYFVHIEALKMGMKPMSKEEIPDLKEVLRGGAIFLIPVALLVVFLVLGFTPTFAACIGMLAIVAVSWLRNILPILWVSWVRKETRMGSEDILHALYIETRNIGSDILDALYIGARNSVSTAAILICAGIVIGVVGITGVGVKFSGMVIELSGGHLFWAIILVMLASLVLGMGLPVTASYIFLAILAAPALQQLGISLLAAHMIIFWYSQDANVTPPVCLAAYSASGIAGSKPMETGFAAWKLAKGLYIIPFLFAYTPLLFEGPLHEVLITALSATLGLLAFTVAMEGHFIRKLFLWERGLVGLATIGLFWPHTTFRILGFLILALVYLPQKLAVRREALRITG